jgi:hypothetical protein
MLKYKIAESRKLSEEEERAEQDISLEVGEKDNMKVAGGIGDILTSLAGFDPRDSTVADDLVTENFFKDAGFRYDKAGPLDNFLGVIGTAMLPAPLSFGRNLVQTITNSRPIGTAEKNGLNYTVFSDGTIGQRGQINSVDGGNDNKAKNLTSTKPSEEVDASPMATPNNMAAYVANLEQNEQSEIAPNVQLLMDTYGITEAEANNYLGIQNINTA